MGALIWRGWAAFCLLAGAVVAPLFLEVFTSGTPIRFLALPLRFAWAWWPGRSILAEGWLSARGVSVGLAGFCALLSGVTFLDLLGFGSVHPGWFLTLEWWQRPLYPWLDLLPRWSMLHRPGYLWIASVWTFVEGFGVSVALRRWRARPHSPEGLRSRSRL